MVYTLFFKSVELFKKIQSGGTKLQDAKELWNIFKSNLNKLSKGIFKSEEQKSALDNIILLCKSRQAVIKLFNEYSLIASEAKTQSKIWTRTEILSPKQMLQRLPIALAQVKVGNTSENLLNEIRQIIYSLYREKEIVKKAHNNIMNSIKL